MAKVLSHGSKVITNDQMLDVMGRIGMVGIGAKSSKKRKGVVVKINGKQVKVYNSGRVRVAYREKKR